MGITNELLLQKANDIDNVHFNIDEAALKVGVIGILKVATDFLS